MMRKMKSLSLVLAASLALSGCSAVGTGTETAAPKEASIGVIAPLTGEGADEALSKVLAVQYANETRPTYSTGRNSYTVSLDVADDGSDPETAAAAAQQLADDGVLAVISLSDTEEADASLPVFAENGVPVISVGVLSDEAQSLTNAFSLGLSDKTAGCACANYMADEEELTSCRIIRDTEEDAFVRAFETAFAAVGGKVLGTTDLPEEDALTALTEDLAEDSPDFLLISVAKDRLSLVASAIESAESTAKIVLAPSLEEAGDLPALYEGALLAVSAAFDGQDGAYAENLAGMTDWLSADAERLAQNGGTEKITGNAVLAFDAYEILLEAASEGGAAVRGNILSELLEAGFDTSGDRLHFSPEGVPEDRKTFIVSLAGDAFVREEEISEADTVHVYYDRAGEKTADDAESASAESTASGETDADGGA